MEPCLGYYDTRHINDKPIRVNNMAKQLSREQGRVVFSSGKENVNRDHELRAETQRNNLRRKSKVAYIPRCSRYGSEI
jgi:hypothetical protein